MKKKVAILGSTGSIGKNTLEIINLNRKNFTILLLSANSNYVTIKHQIKNINPNIMLLIVIKFIKKY